MEKWELSMYGSLAERYVGSVFQPVIRGYRGPFGCLLDVEALVLTSLLEVQFLQWGAFETQTHPLLYRRVRRILLDRQFHNLHIRIKPREPPLSR